MEKQNYVRSDRNKIMRDNSFELSDYEQQLFGAHIVIYIALKI